MKISFLIVLASLFPISAFAYDNSPGPDSEWCKDKASFAKIVELTDKRLLETDPKKFKLPMSCEDAHVLWENSLFEINNTIPGPNRCPKFRKEARALADKIKARDTALSKNCYKNAKPGQEATGGDPNGDGNTKGQTN